MKRKRLGFAVAGSLVALAAWYVQRDHRPDADAEYGIVPSVQGASPQAPQVDKIPEKYRETVRKGLEYLAKKQFPDGHWAGDGGQHPVAITGLVGLALLMDQAKLTRRGGMHVPVADLKYRANIRTAADWLMANSPPRRDGLIFSGHASETARYMEGHGLATLFLAGVCRDETDAARKKKVTDFLTRAVKYIARAQSSQGGWYHTSRVEGHDFAVISATAIQIQALQAAENAGIAIPGNAIQGAVQYLKTTLAEYEKAGAEQNPSRAVNTAAALACEFDPKDQWCKRWLSFCQAKIRVGRNGRMGQDELTHYYYAQALFKVGGETWSGYRKAMFDQLQRSQNEDGSWPAGNGIGVGPIYSTAVWCIVLQLDKESHPARGPGMFLQIITNKRGPSP